MVGAGDHSLWRRLGGLRHVLCYGRIDKNSGAFSYLVFARHGGRKPFTHDDRKWIELVAPHLNGMLQGARGLDLHRLRLGLSSDDWRCAICDVRGLVLVAEARSEEHTSERQSLMRISYVVFCWKKYTRINDQKLTTELTSQYR